MDAINLATVLSVAFLGSFGHCIGMCGGFVVAYTSLKIPEKTSVIKQSIYHFYYNMGRITSYAIMGAFFGFLGSIFSFSKQAQGYLFFIIGIVMILMGLSLFGKIGFLNFLESRFNTMQVIKKLFQLLINSKSSASFYFLGVINGFIPCGLVYFFIAFAVATASVFWGAIVMIIFGLATIPAMFIFANLVGFLRDSFRSVMLKIAGVIVIAYGVYFSFNGYLLAIKTVS